MSLTLEDVRRIAHLARLQVSESDIDKTRSQLNDILGFIEQLQAVNTENTAPMSHAVDLVQRLRPDCISERDKRSDFQALAPETAADLYLVPRVLE